MCMDPHTRERKIRSETGRKEFLAYITKCIKPTFFKNHITLDGRIFLARSRTPFLEKASMENMRFDIYNQTKQSRQKNLILQP